MIHIPDGWQLVTSGEVRELDRVVLPGETQVFEALQSYYGIAVAYFEAVLRRVPITTMYDIDLGGES